MKYVEINARNVLWNKASEDFFTNLLSRCANKFVKKYVNKTIRTWIINEYPANFSTLPNNKRPDWAKNKDIYEIDIKSHDQELFYHYIDFLNTLPERDIKISIKDLPTHVERWEKESQKQALKKEVIEDEITTVYRYKDGYSWVIVTGKKSLKREGTLMNHCVKESYYYDKVKKGTCVIYSLRDKNNKPHVTIEYLPKEKLLFQIQGHSNTAPKKEYIKYINHILTAKKDGKKIIPYTQVKTTHFTRIGLLYQDEKVYNLSSLPSGLVIKDDLDLYASNNFVLPDNLTINGNLNLQRTKITELPKNLHVGGSLYLQGTKIKELPEGLHVKGSLLAEGVEQLSLVHSIRVNGHLYLNSTGVTLLSSGVQVGGNLFLDNSKVTSLPKDLKVGGNLDLSNTNITSLHNLTVNSLLLVNVPLTSVSNIQVKGSLGISSNLIQFLDEIQVGGDIILYHTNIYQNIQIDGSLIREKDSIICKCDLHLNKYVEHLPDNLKINGSLELHDSKIKKLPKNLYIHDDLELKGSLIDELPKGLVVGRLGLNDKIKEIPFDIKVNTLDLRGNTLVTTLPEGIKLKSLYANRFSALEKLPNNITIKLDLNLSGTSIKSLPDSLIVPGSLSLSHCTKLKELPKGLRVGDDLNLTYTKITKLPKDLQVGSRIIIESEKSDIVPSHFKIRIG